MTAASGLKARLVVREAVVTHGEAAGVLELVDNDEAPR
jgi:hypothetical protein